MGKVVIVDKADRPVGIKSYAAMTYEDIYRVSALWLTDEETGDVLMTQRKWTKKNDPGKWMSAVSGTIEEGEGYDENIIHETEEEVGLKNLYIKKGPKVFIDDGKHQYFVQWYLATANKEKVTIRIQEEEVEAYAWVPKQQLVREVREHPKKFVPSLEQNMKTLKLV